MKKPTLTNEQYLDAVFSGKYDEEKIKEIKRWKKHKKIAKVEEYIIKIINKLLCK